VCEIGCGAGEILNQLRDLLAPEVCFTGYELSPQAFELCKTREKPRLEYFLRDFRADGKRFDVALAIDVFEHVEDYMGFLREIREKAEYKIFHIPLALSVQSLLRATPIVESRRQFGHIHYFSKETALATLVDTGYEIVDHFYTMASMDLPSRSVKSFVAKVARKAMYALHEDVAVRVLGGSSLLVLGR
jgi:methyltransferase family protein